jgi:hypothetical protein
VEEIRQTYGILLEELKNRSQLVQLGVCERIIRSNNTEMNRGVSGPNSSDCT